MAKLHLPQALIVVALGLDARIVRGGHGEPVSKKVRRAKNEDDLRRQVRARNARDHSERRHRAVNAAKNPVAQIARLRPLVEAIGDIVGGVAVFEVLRGVRAHPSLYERRLPKGSIGAALSAMRGEMPGEIDG